VQLAENGALSHIAYPAPGTIIALDPDIPPARQRIALQLSGEAGAGWSWRIDGQRVGQATRGAHWSPRPGRHRLALVDAQGGEIEALGFEVRALRGRVSAAR
jgi:penicillin-binding protein 1C